jgi:hypothetical protein
LPRGVSGAEDDESGVERCGTTGSAAAGTDADVGAGDGAADGELAGCEALEFVRDVGRGSRAGGRMSGGFCC